MPRRAAIVGIDGSGKSALVGRLRERLDLPPSRVSTLNCPRYHDTPNAPLGELSRQLLAFSDVADQIGSFEVKLTALYLRLTLYGPIERFLENTFSPDHIVGDRHPLVDTLAYVPLYRSRVASLDAASQEPLLRERLEAAYPGAFAAACAWHELENDRLGRDTDLWALPADIIEAFARPAGEIVAEFGVRYRTTLPDVVVLVDVDPEEAVRRSTGRGAAQAELHENAQALTMVRRTYDHAFDQIAELRPDIELRRITNSGRSLDDSLDELLELLDLTAGAR